VALLSKYPFTHCLGLALEHAPSFVPSEQTTPQVSPWAVSPVGQPHSDALSTRAPFTHFFSFFAEHVPSGTLIPPSVHGIDSQNMPPAAIFFPDGQPHFVALSVSALLTHIFGLVTEEHCPFSVPSEHFACTHVASSPVPSCTQPEYLEQGHVVSRTPRLGAVAMPVHKLPGLTLEHCPYKVPSAQGLPYAYAMPSANAANARTNAKNLIQSPLPQNFIKIIKS